MAGLSFGELIRRRRILKGKPLTEIAKAAGISHSYLSQVESGQKEASPGVQQRLAAVLEIDDDVLRKAELEIPEGYVQVLRTTVAKTRKPLTDLPGLVSRAEALIRQAEEERAPDLCRELTKVSSELRRLNEEVGPALKTLEERFKGEEEGMDELVKAARGLGPEGIRFLTEHVGHIKLLMARQLFTDPTNR